MSVICSGKTQIGKQCCRRVKLPNHYCYDHKSQEVKIIKGDCSICLCEVEQKEDCELKCNHIHHIDCLKGLRQLKCPVCRAPLEGNRLDKKTINNIKQNIEKDKKEKEAEQLEATRRFISDLLRNENAEDGELSDDDSFDLDDLDHLLYHFMMDHPELRPEQVSIRRTNIGIFIGVMVSAEQ